MPPWFSHIDIGNYYLYHNNMAKEKRSHFAVLGMLHYGDMTGYEIRKRLNEAIGYFWQEASASVYPALKSLVAEGLIEAQREVPESGPVRIRYRISEAGRSSFAEWIRQAPAPTAMRNEFALKLFFGNLTDPQCILAYIHKEAESTHDLISNLEAMVDRLPKGDRSLMWRLIGDYGSSMAKATADWCVRAAKTLEASTTKSKSALSNQEEKK